LRRLRRRSLAALRHELEPVPPQALAQFLPQWQHIGKGHALRGIDGLVRAVEQLQGASVPASALEKLVLPSRVAGYTPAMLDELTAAGEVVWAGDRKSTRLNSSHVKISYAVFCWKKKNFIKARPPLA